VEGRLYRAGDPLAEDEKLDYDSSAYDMLHRITWDYPCLTFGFVHDSLGEQRTQYPMTSYLVAGTQAERAADNHLVCLKLSKMARTIHDDDSESDDDSDEDDEDPIVIIEYHHISFDIISVCLHTCIMMYHDVSCDIMFHDIT